MSHQNQAYNNPSLSDDVKSYKRVLRHMRQRYPSLINLEGDFPKYKGSCRVRMIEFPRAGEGDREFDSPQELRDHLGNLASTVTAPWYRVYVLENLNIEYIAVLGDHFNVDPTIFATQFRKANWEGNPEENNTPKLLLRMDPNRSFTLRYSELRLFNKSIAGKLLKDTITGRVLTTPNTAKYLEMFHKVGIVRRCVSFWCDESSNKGCWYGTLAVF